MEGANDEQMLTWMDGLRSAVGLKLGVWIYSAQRSREFGPLNSISRCVLSVFFPYFFLDFEFDESF